MAAPGIAVPGTVVPIGSLTTPGGAQGPTAVSADAGNIATLGSDSLILVPQSTLWSTRLRSFNAVGNPNFEVTQRNCGALVANPPDGTVIEDRWQVSKNAATLTYSVQSIGETTAWLGIKVPGTNFNIGRRMLRIILTGQQATLTGNQCLRVSQNVEGALLRELLGDVHSISLLIRSSVVPISFACSLKDPGSTYSLVKLCTLNTTGFQLIPLPNLPLWPGAVSWTPDPGSIGYVLSLCFAGGPTLTTSTPDVWQAGNFIALSGMSNFASFPVSSSYIDIVFIQHEPGPLCTTLIDKPFTQNLDECLRYYCKTYDYDTAIGSASAQIGMVCPIPTGTTGVEGIIRYPKPLAKVPIITAYNPVTGAANSVRHSNGTDYAVTTFNNVGKSGFQGFATAVLPALAVGQVLRLHYTADTSW